MVRIAYFGTDGCPGHHVIPIRGKFTEEDIKVIESVDCDDFYKVLVKTFRGKLFKKAFERARRGKDISFLKDRKKKVVSTFFTILIMVVCKAVIL